ncbi:amino acid adenylation domain-containing protein [Bacillus thuringiensis]|uniref:amino acid adenylation domain-containing protein n=3 Tax=Bacillus thuringiensis TaxID=1428 RepID=UPI0030CA1E38
MELNGLLLKKYNMQNKIGKFDLMLNSIETSKTLRFSLDYCTELFTQETIENLCEHYINVLDNVINSNEMKISEIDLLSESEKNQILYEFNNTKAVYPKDKTIQELFEDQAKKTPDNIAIVFEDEKLSYKELNEKANCIARVLRNKGVKPDTIVGIMVDKSLETITGILGILKAGGAYLPIDSDYPKKRIEYMLKDSESNILLSKKNLVESIEFNGEIIDLLNEELFNLDRNNLEIINSSSDLAYVIYTSGTTNNPKGVLCEHKNVVRLVNNTNYIEFSKDDKILQTSSMVFDASTFEVWGALLNGLELYLSKNEGIILPELLEKFVDKNNITILWLTSELFNQIAEENIDVFKGLRYLLVGGDVLSPKYISLVRNQFTNLKILNGYGPTENTTFSTTYLIEKEYSSNIPIGKPITNSKAYIVDGNFNLNPVGIYGQLCVSGDGLARGYLNRPELTAEKFVENPFESGAKMYKTGDLAKWLPDGNIEFLGRMDNQVKIRGFRIELGEIENRLLRHKDIKEAVVVVKENKNHEKEICAYVICEKEITQLNLKKYLKESLPEYMIPVHFMRLEKMPLTFNGKLDRKSLPEPIRDTTLNKYEAARNEIEEKLVKIWSEVLGIEKVGINDNFFELGGHSLKITVVISKIHKELDRKVPLKELFKSPTIKELSEFIESTEENRYLEIEKVEEKEYYEASSAQKRMYMLQQFDRTSVAYNMPVVFELEGKVNKEKIEETFKSLIIRQGILRTYFETIEGEIVQKISTFCEFKLTEKKDNEDIETIINKFIRPFELEKGPLFRAELSENRGKYYLLIDMHHIISDGVSMNILINEFTELYNGGTLEPLKLQYNDFASWQNKFLKSEDIKAQEEYWINSFNDEIPVLNLPYDYERPTVQSFKGERVDFEVNEKITENLKKLAKETGTTMHMILLSAFNILLSKYSGQEDVVVGTPIAGRTHADLQNIMGMFVNTLPLRNKPEGDKKYLEFLKEVKENSLKAYENQSYQFETLVEQLNIKRDTSRNPLFDVMFNMIDTVDAGNYIELDKLNLSLFKMKNRTSKVDLSLVAVEYIETVGITLEYCVELFHEDTIQVILEDYYCILRNISTNKNNTLNDIELSSLKHNKDLSLEALEDFIF